MSNHSQLQEEQAFILFAQHGWADTFHDIAQLAKSLILFAQHGWADTFHDIAQLAKSLANPNTIVYTPDLGWLNTWLKITPLIYKVENIATEAISKYPELPWRIVAHSMGALIWLEVLDRHPEWLSKIHSFALVASPVGGSDLGRLFDPFRWFPLMARDLGTNRRSIAEAIASKIPVLTVVGDIGNNTDGTVPVGCSQFAQATFVRLDGIRHAPLKKCPIILNCKKNKLLYCLHSMAGRILSTILLN